jgi:hypothetical protein
MNDSRDVSRPPIKIERRPINYTPVEGTSEPLKEHRKLLIYVGDMVQVIDPKSHLMGKFGLVAEIHPRNPQYQAIIKIGKIKNPLKFHQLKFCTRLDDIPNNKAIEKVDRVADVSDYVDEIDEEEDNKGNREGMNQKHKGLL